MTINKKTECKKIDSVNLESIKKEIEGKNVTKVYINSKIFNKLDVAEIGEVKILPGSGIGVNEINIV